MAHAVQHRTRAQRPLKPDGFWQSQRIGLTVLGEAAPPSDRPTARRFRVKVIEACISKNDCRYTDQLLQASLPLFEKVPVYANHPGDDEFNHDVRDFVGELLAPYWDASLKAVCAILDFVVGDPVADSMRTKLSQKPHHLGLSIYAEAESYKVYSSAGEFEYTDILRFHRIMSADIVDIPGAGGGVTEVLERAPTGAPAEKPKEKTKMEPVIHPDTVALRVTEAERKRDQEHAASQRVIAAEHANEVKALTARITEAEQRATAATAEIATLKTENARLKEASDKAARAAAKNGVMQVATRLVGEAKLTKASKSALLKLFEKAPELSEENVRTAIAEHETFMGDVLREAGGAVGGAGAPPDGAPPAGSPPADALVTECDRAGIAFAERMASALGVSLADPKP